MGVYSKTITLETKENKATYVNVTEEIKQAISESNINQGICVVISPHTTCSVIFEEFVHDFNEDGDEFLQEDLNQILEKIVPDHVNEKAYNYPGEKHYEAVESWPNANDYLPDGNRSALWNGDAHIKSTILGTSEIFSVENNNLGVGSTGYIYFVDFDKTRARKRRCKVIIIGK